MRVYSQLICVVGLAAIAAGHYLASDVSGSLLLSDESLDSKNDVSEDAKLTCPELIKKYGYPAETHKVETKDGYILEMHRIPKPGAQPILLMHGLLDSSSTWVIMGPNKGFAYMLADLGYDVWMGNVRGTRYSRNHKSYNPDFSSAFWDFSLHEIGTKDIPTMIDFVLENTGFDKIHYAGHSQGNLAFWIAASEKPEYNDKILSMHALAPVAYIKNIKSPLVNVMAMFTTSLEIITKILGINEFMPKSKLIEIAGELMCKDGDFTQDICAGVIFILCGFNKDQLNNTMLPVIGGHAPAGASTKQMIQYGQFKNSGIFRQYDYGLIKNLIKYGKISPPEYDLSKVTAKAALYYSENDWMAHPKDVDHLHRQLRNPIGMFLTGDTNFNHLDFVWAIDGRELLFNKVVKIMKLVENGEL